MVMLYEYSRSASKTLPEAGGIRADTRLRCSRSPMRIVSAPGYGLGALGSGASSLETKTGFVVSKATRPS